jgi:hypothetical protein
LEYLPGISFYLQHALQGRQSIAKYKIQAFTSPEQVPQHGKRSIFDPGEKQSRSAGLKDAALNGPGLQVGIDFCIQAQELSFGLQILNTLCKRGVTHYLLRMDVDVTLIDSGRKMSLEPFAEGPSGRREQEEKTTDIGQKTRGKQHSAGGKDNQGVDEFIRGHDPLVHVGPEVHEGARAFHSGQIGSDNCSQDDNADGVEHPDGSAQLDQQSELKEGNEDKGQ